MGSAELKQPRQRKPVRWESGEFIMNGGMAEVRLGGVAKRGWLRRK